MIVIAQALGAAWIVVQGFVTLGMIWIVLATVAQAVDESKWARSRRARMWR